MGLFTNDKRPCVICGGGTPRLFYTEVEGNALCSTCADRISMESELRQNLTMEDLYKYLAWRDENDALKAAFTVTKEYKFGWLAGALEIDEEHGLWRLTSECGGIIFQFENIAAFYISEDNVLICTGSKDKYERYDSGVREQVLSLQGQVQLARALAMRDDRDDNNRELRLEKPFENFILTLELKDHPYWHKAEVKLSAPSFGGDNDIQYYMRTYNETVAKLDEIADVLTHYCFPAVTEGTAGTVQQAAAPVDVATEIKKFKELLDMGAITQQEFDQKKQQLLKM
ncbi:MAG: SHOCT domain-containing protein [Oscillospiraceae bacterium]|nr:SHOCT domain-containing protein [Oscillospiraceae bacterium]